MSAGLTTSGLTLNNGVAVDETGISFLVPTNQIPVSTAFDPAEDAGLIIAIPGPRGQDGRKGDPGPGIVATSIDAFGGLVITYSDGREVRVGQIIGPRGLPGASGRSIRTTSLDGRGHLILTFDDNATLDVGRVVGRQGERGERGLGVAGFQITDAGYLVALYPDGSQANIGYVKGPPGPVSTVPGPVGPAAWSQPTPWTANTSYIVGPPASCVTYQGSSYVCATAHISGSSFDPSNWILTAQKGADGTGTGNVNTSSTTNAPGEVVVMDSTDGRTIKTSGAKIGTSANNVLQLDAVGAIPASVPIKGLATRGLWLAMIF